MICVCRRKWKDLCLGLVFSALSESFERVWRVFGEKMREIRAFIGRICDFPDIDRDQPVFLTAPGEFLGFDREQ